MLLSKLLGLEASQCCAKCRGFSVARARCGAPDVAGRQVEEAVSTMVAFTTAALPQPHVICRRGQPPPPEKKNVLKFSKEKKPKNDTEA